MSSVRGVFILALSIQRVMAMATPSCQAFVTVPLTWGVEGEKVVLFITLQYWKNLTQV